MTLSEKPYASSAEIECGARETLEAILGRCRDELIVQAMEILKDAHDAEDVVQETFVEAYRSHNKLPSFDSAIGWLRHANHANALDRLRSRQREWRRTEVRQQMVWNASFTTGGFSLVELKEAVTKEMTLLPKQKREVVRLRYWNNQSCREIAVQLGLSESGVRRILFEANQMLFRKLKL